MTKDSEHRILDEQIAYYRARASEYDEWFLRQGRYDLGIVRLVFQGRLEKRLGRGEVAAPGRLERCLALGIAAPRRPPHRPADGPSRHYQCQ